VLGSIATFDTKARTVEERLAWFDAHTDPRYPLLTAVLDDAIVGYASLSPYRMHDAYRTTAELSVYVDAAFRGKHAATALMERLFQIARERGLIHTVVSVIVAGNDISIRLHERFGFVFAGRLREVGFKHGAYRDIEQYYLIL